MKNHRDAYGILLLIGCIFAFLSLWICDFLGLLSIGVFEAMNVKIRDSLIDAVTFTIYYVVNAVLCGIVGALSGLEIKSRFFAPPLIVVCLLPTLVLFRDYTTAVEWACIGTTFVIGYGAMLITTLKIKKKQRISQNDLQKI